MKRGFEVASTIVFGLAFIVGASPGTVLHARPDVASPPRGDAILGERIAEAIVFEGKLWLRGALAARNDPSGGLVSLDLANNTSREYFGRGVLDIEKSGSDLWVLREAPGKQHEFILSLWKVDHFEDGTEFHSDGPPLSLLVGPHGPIVLCGETVRMLSNDTHTWMVVTLHGKLRSGVQVSTALTGGSVYVGFNEGEFGGGLQRIDLRSGVVTSVERRDTKAPCSGPLNSDCDPVTGVIPDPNEKECVLASIGLVHLSLSEGRILRVCGQEVRVVSENPTGREAKNQFGETEAFFGLVPSVDGGFWGITWRALYHYDASGRRDQEYQLPRLTSVSGIHLSRAIPGVVVLRTDLNWAVSTSGYTPLVAPLEHPSH